MTTGEERVRKIEEPQAAKTVETQAVPDQALESETGAVEGKVAEIAKTDGEVSKRGGVQAQAKDQKAKDDKTKDDRRALRERLLKNAPKEEVMRAEVKRVLIKKKEKLESDIKKHRRKKQYHLLSDALMQLRQVLRQLEEVAKVGLDVLKEVWLKVVHKFA